MTTTVDLGAALGLREQEQIVLAASYLTLMNADIALRPNPEAARVRHKFRATVADGPLGPPDARGLLPFEEADEVFEDLLYAASETPRCLTLLVDLCSSQPFADIDRLLDAEARLSSLGATAIALGGDVDEDDVERFDSWLREAQEASKSKALRWVQLGLGGLAGPATAGLAAPVIGAAIGGAMGLSGAAAAAAGLAAVGGGPLAAGGLGMAGGTAIVMAAGGAFEAGLGTLVGTAMTPERIAVEAMKLFALIRGLDHYAATSPSHCETFKRLAAEGRKSLRALEASLREAAETARGKKEHQRVLDLCAAEAVVRRLCRRLCA